MNRFLYRVNFRFAKKASALLSVLLSLQACFLMPKAELKSPEAPGLPFSLEINDEVNDGDRLHILGTISAARDWSLKDAIIKLSSIAAGQVSGVSYLPLSKAKTKLQNVIKAGEQYSFTISVPSKDITDYQLELLWGEEAKRYIADLTSGTLEIRGIEIETIRQPCEGTNCKVKFRLKATLYNSTAKTISGVILGIGYVRAQRGEAGLDLGGQIPQNEEQVDVGSITLAPGMNRRIVLNFDEEIPEAELVTAQGEIKPAIRIISFSSD